MAGFDKFVQGPVGSDKFVVVWARSGRGVREGRAVGECEWRGGARRGGGMGGGGGGRGRGRVVWWGWKPTGVVHVGG